MEFLSEIKNMQTEISKIKPCTDDMHTYINGLSKKQYASLATVYIVGRSGWDRNHLDSLECISYYDSLKADGIAVTQKMMDDKFLTCQEKKNQIAIEYDYELSHIDFQDGEYLHNWLSLKPNLSSSLAAGIAMLEEVADDE